MAFSSPVVPSNSASVEGKKDVNRTKSEPKMKHITHAVLKVFLRESSFPLPKYLQHSICAPTLIKLENPDITNIKGPANPIEARAEEPRTFPMIKLLTSVVIAGKPTASACIGKRDMNKCLITSMT